jgi:hypothetical protein
MKNMLFIFLIALLNFSCTKEIGIKEFEEFKEYYDDGLSPIGTYFWEEFSDIEQKYNLTHNENKLLGEWMNMSTETGDKNNRYIFFPNKLFILYFSYNNFQIIDTEKKYFSKAIGTWEIANDMVRITVYSIITKDETKDIINSYSDNKEYFIIEQPYTVDFINIHEIDERGFTKRQINDAILSKELQRKVRTINFGKTNRLYARTVYVLSPLARDTLTGGLMKLYGYFEIVPDMAQENISGFELVTTPELIEKYILNLWP